MRDFSKYRDRSPYSEIVNGGMIIFDKQLQGGEGADVLVGSKKHRVIVRNSGNPLNAFQEEREISCKPEVEIKRGDYVVYNKEHYLIVSDVDDHNIYHQAKMQKCNHITKFMNGKKICVYPSIIVNQNKYTIGINEGDLLQIGNGRYSVQLPLNEDTLTLERKDRFLFNKSAWEIADIDLTTQKGLINIMTGETQFESEHDDIVNEIANRWCYQTRPSYEFIYDKEITVKIGDRIDTQLVITNNGNIVELPYVVEFNNDFIVDDIAVKKGTTEANIKVRGFDDVYEIKIVINIVDEIIEDTAYEVVCDKGFDIRKYNTNRFDVVKTKNGNIVDSVYDIEVVTNGIPEDSITIVETGDDFVKVRNNRCVNREEITIVFTDKYGDSENKITKNAFMVK